MLGRMCSTEIRARPFPATRAARMNSRCQRLSAAPRAVRALPAYGIGVMAMFWTLERVSSLG